MNKIDWVRKLTSRKFWVSIAGFISMLVVALGGSDNQSAQVAALIMAGATVIGYVLGEGLSDASNKGIDEGYYLIEEDVEEDGSNSVHKQ